MRQYLAANRFGLGLRPGDAPIPDGDVTRWLGAQWDGFDPNPAVLANLPTRAQLAEYAAMEAEEWPGLRGIPWSEVIDDMVRAGVLESRD